MVEFVSRLPGWSSKQKHRHNITQSNNKLTANTVEDQSSKDSKTQSDNHDFKNHFKYTKDVCALSWWEPIKLLEEGSISDIHLVRRRKEFVKVQYKDKRDVMSLAKRHHHLPWDRFKKQKDGEEVYVLKSIMKDHVDNDDVLDEMRQEIFTMSKLDHPNICRLIEAYERRRHVYLVMEYCSGGNLASRVPMEEKRAAVVCRKILSALEYMHGKGVAHRDIKLENIMIDKDGEVKLIDFGLATAYLSDQYSNMTDTVGTLYSMAPEVLNGSYDERCDIFSVGVVAYVLLSGLKPFWGSNEKMAWKDRRLVMIDLIKKNEYTPMTGRAWKDVCGIAKDFVRSLLQLNPDDRPTPNEALHSQWIMAHGYESNKDVTSLALSVRGEETLDQLHFARHGLLTLLCTKLEEDEIVGLQAYVESCDEDGQCTISFDTLYNILLEATSCNKEELDAVFEYCDTAESKMNYVDFFAEVLIGRGRNTIEKLAARLDSLDVDGTRNLKSADVKLVVSNVLPAEMVASILSALKIDKDGMVNTSELLSDVTERYAGRHRDSIHSGRTKS